MFPSWVTYHFRKIPRKSRGNVSPKMWPSALLYWMIGWHDPNKIRGKYTTKSLIINFTLRDGLSHLLKLVFDWFPHLQSKVQIFILHLTYFSNLTLFLVFCVNWTVFSLFHVNSCFILPTPASEAILTSYYLFFSSTANSHIQGTGQISVLNIMGYNLYFPWRLDLHNPGGETST